MSDSVHRQQPTRLPRPWDSPGKNTGVGCHFLLQCMKVKSESEVAQSCPTLRPHGLQPPRLLHPWDFPGKNTGVGAIAIAIALSSNLSPSRQDKIPILAAEQEEAPRGKSNSIRTQESLTLPFMTVATWSCFSSKSLTTQVLGNSSFNEKYIIIGLRYHFQE